MKLPLVFYEKQQSVSVYFKEKVIISNVLSTRTHNNTESPTEKRFLLSITYKDDSSSQTLTVHDSETSKIIYSFTGYGKDNTVYSEHICLSSKEYRLVARDGLRDRWTEDSFFSIYAENTFEVLRGTCDFGGQRDYIFFPSVPVPLASEWLFSDAVLPEKWYAEDYDDSDWQQNKHGSFPAYYGRRFYRLHVTMNMTITHHFGAALFALHSRNISSLYVHDQPIYEDYDTSEIYDLDDEQNDSHYYFQYSIPLSKLSPSFVIAVKTDVETSTPIDDLFQLALVLLPFSSSRLINGVASSEHARDYYSNQLFDATDSSRYTFWKINGGSAEMTFAFNQHRFEYVNAYSITCTDSVMLAPYHWVVWGCVDDVCEVLDRQDSGSWDGSFQTRSFLMNVQSKSFQSFLFSFRIALLHSLSIEGDDFVHELRIAEIALFLDSGAVPSSLQYPQQSYTFISGVDMVQIAPLVNHFTDFRVSPAIPSGMEFDMESGEISGLASGVMSNAQFSVSAMDLITGRRETTILFFTIIGCVYPESNLVNIAWTSYLNSEFEEWRLVDNEGLVVASGHGLNCGSSSITQSMNLCLNTTMQYSIQRRVQHSLSNSYSGSMAISVSTPYFNKPSTNSYRVIAVLPFHSCSAFWSGEDQCSTYVFSSGYLSDSSALWHVNSDWWVDKNWYTIDYQEDNWWIPMKLTDEMPHSNTYWCRYTVTIDDIALFEAVEISVYSQFEYYFYVNEWQVTSYGRVSTDTGTTFRLTADLFRGGKNVLAVRFYINNYLSNSTSGINLYDTVADHSSHNPDRSNMFSILIYGVYTSHSAITSNHITASSTNPVPHYPASYAFDYNPNTEWIGALSNNEATISMNFDKTMMQGINCYCIISSLTTNNFDPISWKLRGIAPSQRWMVVSSYSNIHFTERGQRRCFPITNEARWYAFSSIQITFFGDGKQTQIQLSQISFHTLAYNTKDIPPFKYTPSRIDVVPGVEFPSVETPSLLYSHYHAYPGLPSGLSMDEGNGVIFGSAQTSFESISIIVQATSLNGIVETSITLRTTQCDYPFSYLTLQFNKTEVVSMYLSFSLYNQDSELFEQIVPVSTSPVVFNYCVKNDQYRLLFSDKRNSGFIDTSFAVTLDSILIHQGFFNAGFSNQELSFFAGTLLSPSTYWYYSLDNSTPPDYWYKQIDPVHEEWEVAQSGSFPNPEGITQYFKTVFDLESLTIDLDDYSAFIFYIAVKGGFVLYLNGEEKCRQRLPPGKLSKTTQPLGSFPTTEIVQVSQSVQFASFSKSDVIVIAVEIHDMEVQQKAEFSFGVRLVPNNAEYQFHQSLSSNQDEDDIENLDYIADGQLYNKAVIRGTCDDIEITIDTMFYDIPYLTEFCMFTGNTIGEYPHSIALYGGTPSTGNLRGDEIQWVELYSNDEVFYSKVVYGEHQCFHFYNDQSFGLYRFVLNDCEHKENMEIAEIQFFSKRLDGYCVDPAVPSNPYETNRTPSGEWKDFGCSELYLGRYWEYCENGNWTQILDECRPRPPAGFKYHSNLFTVKRRHYTSIEPVVVGAELIFFINVVPEGMQFNNFTGELSGIYEEDVISMDIVVTVMNAGGKQEASFTLYVINDHEELLLVIAVMGVALLLAFIFYIAVLLHRGTGKALRDAEKSHLHTNELPNNMIKLLL